MAQCTHLSHIHHVTPSAKGCEECLKSGDDWVHLRECLECGHVGKQLLPTNVPHIAKHTFAC
jgi:Zn ribbon nucleic-acid-binding protein